MGVTDWPEFHNGVATGLRVVAPLPPEGAGGGGGGGGGGGARGGAPATADAAAAAARVLRTWVKSHR
jgi:ABC-type glycerol-3-phosphate transport system substrate-binding protein